jgi:microsomal epoxide hydrolase
MSFSNLPAGASGAIKPFSIEISQQELDELKTMVKLSRIAVPTYENSQSDGRYGVKREFLQTIKDKWVNFDWYVYTKVASGSPVELTICPCLYSGQRPKPV